MADRIRRRRVDAVGRTCANGLAQQGCRPAAALARRRPSRGTIRDPHTEVSVKRSIEGSGTGHETGHQGEAGRIDPPTQRGEARMVNVQSIDDLARRLAALVPPGLKEARDDLAANFKSA